MKPAEIRQAATSIILSHARDVERMSIREHLQEEEFEFTNADINTIYELIDKARIAIDFPRDDS